MYYSDNNKSELIEDLIKKKTGQSFESLVDKSEKAIQKYSKIKKSNIKKKKLLKIAKEIKYKDKETDDFERLIFKETDLFSKYLGFSKEVNGYLENFIF